MLFKISSGKPTDRWDLASVLILASFALLHSLSLPLFPFFMDIYYHLLNAWGFLQAGGYSGWDFWQFAPAGRENVYPPVFHLILSGFLALGIDGLLLAKIWELIAPLVFLSVLWWFCRDNFGKSRAFWSLAVLGSSASFFTSLSNYIPSTLSLVFGLCALHQFLRRSYLRMALWLILSAYTHVASFTFIFLGMLFFSLCEAKLRKQPVFYFLGVLLLVSPILLKQLPAAGVISGGSIPARFFYEFKPLEYFFAAIGVYFAIRKKGREAIPLFLFIASLIFLSYPNRFLYGQGYLAVIFLGALGIDSLLEATRSRYRPFALAGVVFCLLLSPTWYKEAGQSIRSIFFDTAEKNLLLPGNTQSVMRTTIWNERLFSPVVAVISQHSAKDEIVYASLSNAAVALAAVSGRPTSKALFPEVKPSVDFDDLAVARIAVFMKDDPFELVRLVSKHYGLKEIFSNDSFRVFINPAQGQRMLVRRSALGYPALFGLLILWVLLYVLGGRVAEPAKK